MLADGGDGCGQDRTWPVGLKPAGVSPYGAMDMAGNVWEWVSDWYDVNYYASSSKPNPSGAKTGSYRVLRGGSWFTSPNNLRCAYRNYSLPDNQNDYRGFRCAR